MEEVFQTVVKTIGKAIGAWCKRVAVCVHMLSPYLWRGDKKMTEARGPSQHRPSTLALTAPRYPYYPQYIIHTILNILSILSLTYHPFYPLKNWASVFHKKISIESTLWIHALDRSVPKHFCPFLDSHLVWLAWKKAEVSFLLQKSSKWVRLKHVSVQQVLKNPFLKRIYNFSTYLLSREHVSYAYH